MTNFETYQTAVMVVAIAGAATLSLVLLAAAIWPYLAAAWDALGRKNARKAMLVMAALATLYGGAKHIVGRVTFPRTDPEVWYLLDSGSYTTNDAVHVSFNRNLILPSTANIYIEGLELSYTNENDWAEHSFLAYSNTMGNVTSPFDLPFANATNYNWIVYTDWTPPPTTHTNGVAYATWQRSIDGSTNVISTVKTGIYVDSLRVAPNPALTNSPPTSGATLLSTPQGEP